MPGNYCLTMLFSLLFSCVLLEQAEELFEPVDTSTTTDGDTAAPTDTAPPSDSADTGAPVDSGDSASPEDSGDSGDTGGPPPQTRGIWAWQDSGDPYGTLAVVGDGTAEDDMVADLVSWGVARVYGSYGNRPISEPEVIADWNVKLHAAGIESHVLLGEPDDISSREWAALEEKIQERLLEYNDSRTDPLERFDGLHLDIEPQALSEWSGLDEAGKYAYLGLLADTYEFVEDVMDFAGSALPVRADLAVWFDKLPPPLGGTGSVGWPATGDRDDWFGTLAVDGVSMMAYERDDLLDIEGDVADEGLLFPGELRVGLNEEVGTTWLDIDEMFDMAELLEADGYAVDLHSYSKIRAQFP